MRFSITWIGVLLIAGVLLWFSHYGKHVYETFTSTQEGFMNAVPLEDDIQMDTCPAKSNRYVDSNGQVLCCDGEVQNNQCRGKTICSLSEGSGTIPKCGLWFASYLNEKGRDRCPASMPNYWESADGSKRGCVAGRRNKTGSGPLQASQKSCRLYTNQNDDERQLDSCSVQMMLENAKCFSREYPGTSKSVLVPWWNKKAPAFIQCSIRNGMSVHTCGENNSWNAFIDREIDQGALPRNWRNTTNEWDKLYFCSNTEKVHILKTMRMADLKKTPTPTS